MLKLFGYRVGNHAVIISIDHSNQVGVYAGNCKGVAGEGDGVIGTKHLLDVSNAIFSNAEPLFNGALFNGERGGAAALTEALLGAIEAALDDANQVFK